MKHVHDCKHFMIDMPEINSYLCGCCSDSHSKDFISDNHIFIVVITIIIIEKWISLSSLPVECGLSFSHAFWEVRRVHILLYHYNYIFNCKPNVLLKLFIICFYSCFQ